MMQFNAILQVNNVNMSTGRFVLIKLIRLIRFYFGSKLNLQLELVGPNQAKL